MSVVTAPPFPRRESTRGLLGRAFAGTTGPVAVVVLVIVVVWYVAAVLLNAPLQRSVPERGKMTPAAQTIAQVIDTVGVSTADADFAAATLDQARPKLPAPHQVAIELWNTVFKQAPTSNRSLVYHSWVTLSSTLVGFVIGTLLGIALAVGIVHLRSLDRSLMPWLIASQAIPILAIAPVIVVAGFTAMQAWGFPQEASRFIPKAIISTYLSFFPVTVGMVKGLRSPETIHLDLMRTYSASRWQTFWKLRWPYSVPYLFVSMKIAIAASLVGAIVGELPTGAVAGLGSRLLGGSYYGQTVQIWAALFAAAVMAAVLVALLAIAERLVLRRMGTAAA